jgi:hypothetical protein
MLPTFTCAVGPKMMPLRLMRKTRPVACRAPKICEGLAWKIWFKATELEEGCTNLTVPSAEMSKLCQFSVAFAVVWLTVRVDPA